MVCGSSWHGGATFTSSSSALTMLARLYGRQITACYVYHCSKRSRCVQSILERLKAIFMGIDPLMPSKIPPTVGLNIGRMKINQRQLIFWDLGGSSSLRSLWEKYYSEAHALLYVVDACDPLRLDESRDVLRQLLGQPDLAGLPLLVFANKQDAPGAITPHEVQARFGLQSATREGGRIRPTHVLGSTSLSGEGVEEGVFWLVDVLQSHPRPDTLGPGSSWDDEVPTKV